MKYLLLLSICCILSISASSQNNLGYGLKKPTEEQIKSFPFVPNFSLPPDFTLPPKVDISDEMPPVGNQGYQGSCTAFAVAYAAKSYQEKKQYNWLFNENGNIRNDRICSPSFIFNTIKNRNGNYNCLEGIWFWEAFKILETMGTSFLSDFPYNEQDCNTQPNSSIISKAEVNKISTSNNILNTENLNEIKYNLYVGNPIIIGFNNCDHFQPDGFEAYKRGKDYTYIPKSVPNPDNYHAMVCVGYNDQTQTFKIMNSWGNDWGNSGYFNVPYAFFGELVSEAYTINDAWPSRSFVTVNKEETETTNSFLSYNLYWSWFKEGYFREFQNLRLGLTSLNQKGGSVTVIFTDIQKEEIVNTITYKINTPQTFYYKEQRITFTLTKFARAGRNPFTKAAYFQLSIDNYIDEETKNRIKKINNLLEHQK